MSKTIAAVLWVCVDCDETVVENDFEVEECKNCGSTNIIQRDIEIEVEPHEYN